MSGAAPKLSDDRVRERLACAVRLRENGSIVEPSICWLGHIAGDFTAAELEALAQQVLDLRTANNLLQALDSQEVE